MFFLVCKPNNYTYLRKNNRLCNSRTYKRRKRKNLLKSNSHTNLEKKKYPGQCAVITSSILYKTNNLLTSTQNQNLGWGWLFLRNPIWKSYLNLCNRKKKKKNLVGINLVIKDWIYAQDFHSMYEHKFSFFT